jgi:hypothetical protein
VAETTALPVVITAGVTSVAEVDDVTFTDVAAYPTPPIVNVNDMFVVKFVPDTVTDVPPDVGPVAGDTPVNVGRTVAPVPNPIAFDVPPGVITRTVTPELAIPLGEIAVICVFEFTVNDAAFVPLNCTAVAPSRFVPVITTGVPPAEGPELGLSPPVAMVGTA